MAVHPFLIPFSSLAERLLDIADVLINILTGRVLCEKLWGQAYTKFTVSPFVYTAPVDCYLDILEQLECSHGPETNVDRSLALLLGSPKAVISKVRFQMNSDLTPPQILNGSAGR